MTVDMVKEVKTLMKMAVNWRKGYETWLTPDDDNDYVYQEFADEIVMHLLPYVNRLVETDYLSESDAKALVLFFFEQIEYLKQLSKEMASDHPPVSLWQ